MRAVLARAGPARSPTASRAGRRRHRWSGWLHRPALLRQRHPRPARRDVHRQPQPGPVQRHQAVPRGRRAGRPGHRPAPRSATGRAAPGRRAAAGRPTPGHASTEPRPAGRATPRYLREPGRPVAASGALQGRRRRGQRHGRAHRARPCSARPPACRSTVVPLYFELDGTFPNHEANPLEPENLRDLQAAVREHGADIGLAFDGDADRCFVIDERGEPVSPSRGHRAGGRRASSARATRARRCIHNLITSRAVPEIVARARRQRRCAPGSATRSSRPRWPATGAVFGGEHSAHYYFRDFWCADTGMLAALHVLAALGGAGRAAVGAGRATTSATSPRARSTRTVADAAGRDRRRSRAAFAARRRRRRRARRPDRPTGDGPTGGSTCAPRNTEPLLRLNVEAADRDDHGRRARRGARASSGLKAADPDGPSSSEAPGRQIEPGCSRSWPARGATRRCATTAPTGGAELVCTGGLRAGLPRSTTASPCCSSTRRAARQA